MEQKKTRRADIEQRRTTGFLLGLIFVLSIFYVTLEWNSTDSNDDINPIDLDELMHESELVPMSNEELTTRIEEKQKTEKAEQLHVVDDQVELQPDDVDIAVELAIFNFYPQLHLWLCIAMEVRVVDYFHKDL